MTKIVCVSDTHLAEPDLPKGDILIHAGDFTYRGTPKEIAQSLYWLAKHIHKYEVVIITPGNHDWGYELDYSQNKQECVDKGIYVLNDEALTFDGIKFWGSPITPEFCSWAFNRDRGAAIRNHWDLIPEDTNVLISHGPPYGILDGVPKFNKELLGYDKHYRPMWAKKVNSVEHTGCQDLLLRITQLKQLKLHVFGHIHESYGLITINGVQYINASIMDGDYQPVNKPIITEI